MKITQPKNRLTNAYKRGILTLGSIMVKITYHDKLIECEDAEEAIKILKAIEHEEEFARLTTNARRVRIEEDARRKFGYTWTAQVFRQLVDSLGESQKRVLTLLVRKNKASDEELRKTLKLESNQQLAGVLSGISKQAAALNIPARSIFLIENESKGGETTKTYAVASEFSYTATENNWLDE